MTGPGPHDDELVRQAESFLAGDLSGQGLAELRSRLASDPGAADTFVCVAEQVTALHEVFSSEAEQPNHLNDIELNDFLEIIADLDKSAEPIRPVQYPGRDQRRHRRRESTASDRIGFASAVWLLYHTIPHKKAAAGLGLAAAIVLGFVWYMVTGGPGEKSDSPQIVDNTPTVPEIESVPIVASLTAERDAVWDRRPGEDLYAGQRFTLTQGFVEITTRRGAVAILEAPATIELTDNNNAIRLHTGKLVGICEAESSKGFLVRTPHMDVVDLGTEFGVTVRRNRVETVVFDGEVEVYPTMPPGASGSTAPVRLSRGQYAAAGPAGTLASGDIAEGSVGLSYLRSLNPNEVASRRYAQAVLESKPLIYWGMQDLAAQAVVNRGTAGNRYDGLAQAAEQQEGGVGGAYARFGNAGDDSVIAVDKPIEEIQRAGSYTIECWARVEKHHRGMIAVLTADNRLSTMHLEVLDDLFPSDVGGVARAIRFVHRDKPSTGGGQQLYSDPYQLGAWMHLVCVKNGDTVALYVDGEMVAMEACKRRITGTPHLMLGRLNPKQDTLESDVRSFHGGLDEFALYPHALDHEIIRRHYALGTEALVDQ